jgi:hypothetical protein
LLEGDANTKFSISLQTVDIERPRIFQLQDGDNIINREDDIKRHIATYYKGLFGRPEESTITLDVGSMEDIPQVTLEEN